jgi:hypothetical protein
MLCALRYVAVMVDQTEMDGVRRDDTVLDLAEPGRKQEQCRDEWCEGI